MNLSAQQHDTDTVPQRPQFCAAVQQEIVSEIPNRLSDGADKRLEPLEARLVELMREGWLSPQDALRLAGCFSLSQRVSEMKREHSLPIVDEWRQVGRSRFKVYSLREGSA
jgi:hypothetical protein